MGDIIKIGRKINHPEYGIGEIKQLLKRIEGGNRVYDWEIYFGGCLYIPIPEKEVQKYLVQS